MKKREEKWINIYPKSFQIHQYYNGQEYEGIVLSFQANVLKYKCLRFLQTFPLSCQDKKPGFAPIQ